MIVGCIKKRFVVLVWLVALNLAHVCQSFQSTTHLQQESLKRIAASVVKATTNGDDNTDAIDRKRFLKSIGVGVFSTITTAGALPKPSYAKSYSANARNLERVNTGDMSGGSLYDNNPKTESGKKRRAMVGCKSPIAREEASSNNKGLSEKDCNQMVLGGETDFMLQALQKLDCPACPYGISDKRN